jgi:hypothetical protein
MVEQRGCERRQLLVLLVAGEVPVQGIQKTAGDTIRKSD